MNILNKVSLQGLIKNRARTLVTIAGAALSAALFTGVSTFAVSLQAYMVKGAESKYGSWHLQVFDAGSSFLTAQAQDSRVSGITAFEDIGYALLEGGQNADKPYLFIAGFSEDSFSLLPLSLLDGRLPENSGEVLVPTHVENNGGVKLALGDTLTLPTGRRSSGGQTLTQADPYRGEAEALQITSEKSYTVVGVYQRPAFEMRFAPGYTLITLADPSDPAESLTAFLALKQPRQAHAFAGTAAKGHAVCFNDNVLRFLGASNDPLFTALFYSLAAILLALIMTGSVFMIYNAFHISLNERTHEFGILMSAGATGRQLRGSVVFEGMCIGCIGIPPGMLLAIPGIALLLSLVAKNFSNILYSGATLQLKISIPALAFSAALSLITILISAYIPAKRAAGMPVMACIRQTRDIKADGKSLRAPRWAARLCGLEGTLAFKSFRRNRGRYRSVILSLTFSVVLFVVSSYFKTCFVSLSDQARVITDFDISFSAPDMEATELAQLCQRLQAAPGVAHASCRTRLECTANVSGDLLSDAFWQAAGRQPTAGTTGLTANVLILSDSFYRQLVEGLGLSPEEYAGAGGKLLAVGKMEAAGYAQGPDDLQDLFVSPSLEATLFPHDSEGQDLSQGLQLSLGVATFVPPDAPAVTGKPTETPYYFEILAPWSMRGRFLPEGAAHDGEGIAIRSPAPGQTTAALKEMLAGLGIPGGYTLYNFHAMLEENRNMLFIVNLFTLVFVAMIALIAVANVFNTISTNIRLRRRELAMLRSVGMTERSFNRMMRLECALYGLRTLLYGIPLSLILSWLIYFGLTCQETDAFPFSPPWGSLIISICGVFLVIFVTMLYATGRLRRENIIDALRDELS